MRSSIYTAQLCLRRVFLEQTTDVAELVRGAARRAAREALEVCVCACVQAGGGGPPAHFTTHEGLL